MPQKPLGKGKKILLPGKGIKKNSANRGKLYEKTKKGRRNIAPKKASAKTEWKQTEEISKVINAKNEETSAAKAVNAADKLSLLKADRSVCESLKGSSRKRK
uniref:Uncharacterized protein n=1 Tax=Tetraselmis sp. GSL018 TaxID=582737 RepID=A0A061RGT5_9CHLO|mmetsp:Transcript_19536/g.46659  ORF Transcript_19536/g.46659 Transcript_19536/m.46659 type:complete len:102 (-) Transcript_19536:426-731(-)